MITFQDVSKKLPGGRFDIRNISFEVDKGDLTFITGSSGSGKTTLLKLIMMEERPDSGVVEVAGCSSDTIVRREVPYLRRKIGMIYQDFKLLQERTVAGNLSFVLEVTGVPSNRIRSRVLKTTTDLRIGHLKDAYPSELSGGEQQKVAIARAIINDPYVLLADEPTRNLDTESSMEILRTLKEINSMGTTVLIVSHKDNLLEGIAHHRIEMSLGEIEGISHHPV